MKKIIILLSLLFIPWFASATISTNLSYGLRNNADVKQLQEFLIGKSFLAGTATGNFYSLTSSAVKKYQASKNIKPTGSVGMLTRTAINNELASQSLVNNTGTTTKTDTTAPTPAPQKTTSDASSALQSQIQSLQQQLTQVQQQSAAQQQIIQQQQTAINQIVNPAPVSGCTFRQSANYNPLATSSDGSCMILGCTDKNANNYNPTAKKDDGSCIGNLVRMYSGATLPSTISPQSNALLGDYSMSIVNASVILKSLRFKMIGSAAPTAFQNLNLYVDNVQFGTTVNHFDTISGSEYIAFSGSSTLAANYYDIKLTGDIIGGNGRTFEFSIQNGDGMTISDVSGLAISPSGLPLNETMQTIMGQ